MQMYSSGKENGPKVPNVETFVLQLEFANIVLPQEPRVGVSKVEMNLVTVPCRKTWMQKKPRLLMIDRSWKY